MKAVLRRTRISPKKANLIAGMVRGKSVNEALNILKFVPKKGADILYKVIHSAAYNAKNNFSQSIDDLIITKILVTKGPMYKRTMPVSRGRAHAILKRTAHITVEVGLPEGKEVKKPVKAEQEVKEVKAEKAESHTDKEVKAKKSAPKKKAAVKKEDSEKKENKTKKSK